MGQPNNIEPAKINENYGWGEFGSAGNAGVNLSSQASGNVYTTQKGIGQYLDELISPSYDNESFRARQQLLDERNAQYARELGAQAIARGARGSATQNILNSIMANRNNDMRNAMTAEDARVRNILSALSGIEGNYWQQSNAMANNILSRQTANQANQQAVNNANTAAYNAWKNELLSTGVGAALTLMGSPLAAAALTGGLTKGALGNGSGPYGMATPYGDAIDPMQVASANNMF
jgi:hypothetical protein